MHNSKAEITYDLLAQKGGARLYSTLGTVYGTVVDTDVAPTQGAREVYAEATKELVAHGLDATSEENVSCCYAVQDKVWVHDPDGAPWEVYTVLADAPTMSKEMAGEACC